MSYNDYGEGTVKVAVILDGKSIFVRFPPVNRSLYSKYTTLNVFFCSVLYSESITLAAELMLQEPLPRKSPLPSLALTVLLGFPLHTCNVIAVLI